MKVSFIFQDQGKGVKMNNVRNAFISVIFFLFYSLPHFTEDLRVSTDKLIGWRDWKLRHPHGGGSTSSMEHKARFPTERKQGCHCGVTGARQMFGIGGRHRETEPSLPIYKVCWVELTALLWPSQAAQCGVISSCLGPRGRIAGGACAAYLLWL